MTAIYVLRHPQTTWNATSRYQGRLEAPVSREGRTQIKLVCRAFAGSSLAAVYSSPLRRAVGLAAQLAHETDAQLVIDNRLTEIAQTPWEGLFVAEIMERYSAMYKEWRERPDLVEFPVGERLADVEARILSALHDMMRAHHDCNVAMVSHSVAIQVLVARVLGLPLRDIHRIPVHNASITTLCGHDSPHRLLCLNNTDPLYRSPVASARAQACVS